MTTSALPMEGRRPVDGWMYAWGGGGGNGSLDDDSVSVAPRERIHKYVAVMLKEVFFSSLDEYCRPGCSSCGSSERMLSVAAWAGGKDEAERPPVRRCEPWWHPMMPSMSSVGCQ